MAETVLSTLGFSRREFGSRARKETDRDLLMSEVRGEEQMEKETESRVAEL